MDRIEFVCLSHSGPPGAKQACQSSSIWFRHEGGEWKKSTHRSRYAFALSEIVLAYLSLGAPVVEIDEADL